MNAIKVLAAALAASVAAGGAVAQAQPASYAEGIVRALDVEHRTVTLESGTYVVRSPWELDQVNPGDKVDITYVMVDGQRVALAVTLK